ncbi:sigma 54-interacting transcriptional regulator [Geoalkalibacter sp.]|uniref:sigma 54-interacting transcriptional regulator n=1 Tax=Geoalkalibacter sp. TaxID=3041440 RepID=UPI00272E47AF|nr:sigma 54-interacting transcriptional regulator [Geoalkalibacter sp.]
MDLNKKRILLVDDDEDLLRLLSMRLTSNGYEVSCAQSGEQALALLPVLRPHLVITDLRMEGMDGMALFEAIRKSNTSLPVFIMTAHGSIPDAVTATRRGVFSFLTKPLNGRELLRDVEKALTLSPGGAGADSEQAWRGDIITQSPLMEDLLSKARLAAASGASILIRGESGTGKELLAQAIHRASPRADKPFVPVNCGAIPDNLLESELFGHVKGSFTGADRNYAGLFRSADGGTLFLDEIGDMPLTLQVKLLRVLQEKQVRAIGSALAVAIDVRIISATHRTLEDEIQEGHFREDLYYRLNVVSLELPSLAERREDIPLLANYFLRKFAEESDKPLGSFSPDAMEVLVAASWPGNIRQLCNVVEQAVTLSTSAVISSDLVNSAIRETPDNILSFADARRQFEQEYLVQLLKITRGNVSHAARLAKRNRTEFYKLLSRHHIVPTLFK